jgi:hypothetical protein
MFQQPKFKDFKQQSIERQNALTNAVNVCIHADNIQFQNILDAAEIFLNWVANNEKPK